MFSKAASLVLFFCVCLTAQTLNHRIDLSPDSPVALLSDNFENSNATAQGGAYVMDIHATLSLRNSGQKRIRGAMLVVYAQEVTPGGKGSVAAPTLDVAPGDTFSVRIDTQLRSALAPTG